MVMEVTATMPTWSSISDSWEMAQATMMRHPFFLLLGVVLTVALVAGLHIMRKGKGGRYEGGIKAANTRYAKALPEYVARKKKLRMAMAIVEGCVIAGLLASFAVMARPSAVLTEEGDAKKRDIFLCLDVSYSIFAQNEQLVDSLKGVVEGLDGERFGITIFNSSSVMYVPMTDDYDYILEQLDVLNTYFKMQAVVFQEELAYYGEEAENMPEVDQDLLEEYKKDPLDFEGRMLEVESGVLSGSSRGSSIIGEGLATCLYSFPHLEDESRTRVIILSTDNDPASFTEDVSFKQAGDLCAKHDVTVYGIFPSEDDLPMGHTGDYGKAQKEFDSICDETGGKLYVAGHGKMDVKDAVSDIKSKEAITIKEPSKRYQIDTPMMTYGALMASVLVLFGTVVVMRPW